VRHDDHRLCEEFRLAAEQTRPGPQATPARPPREPEKRVTFTELFFDLVFVFAVTQVSGLLHEDYSTPGVARALVVFIPLYWGWVGMTIHANTHDVDNPVDWLGVFAAGLCSLLMAVAIPEAYGDRGLLFGCSYLALRAILAALVFRGTYHSVPLNSFSIGLFVTGPLLVAGGLVDGSARVWLWAVAAAVDLLVPRVLRGRLARIPFDTGHLSERFGLFIIIALGESVVAVGLIAVAEATAGQLAAVGLAWALACGLWWTYFHFAAGAVRHALSTAAVPTEVIRPVLAYGHLVFIAGIVAVAVGLGEVVAHPDDPLAGGPAALLCGGAALYLATFGYTRWRMFRTLSLTRLSAATVCLLLVPLAIAAPGLATLAVLAAVLAGLNVLEALAVWRRSRRSPSQPR
jgi:low temperature requirement protein LtrA